MYGKFKIENPKEIEMTMTVTMELKEWIELRNQFTERERLKYPSYQFCGLIEKLIQKGRQEFSESENDNEKVTA